MRIFPAESWTVPVNVPVWFRSNPAIEWCASAGVVAIQSTAVHILAMNNAFMIFLSSQY